MATYFFTFVQYLEGGKWKTVKTTNTEGFLSGFNINSYIRNDISEMASRLDFERELSDELRISKDIQIFKVDINQIEGAIDKVVFKLGSLDSKIEAAILRYALNPVPKHEEDLEDLRTQKSETEEQLYPLISLAGTIQSIADLSEVYTNDIRIIYYIG